MTCKHVYEIIGADICPACGRDTHETNFRVQNDLHRQWIADGKADWNVCPQGGTIRGWWSI
jgi:hypothetical protein